jgi:hypothetical protein
MAKVWLISASGDDDASQLSGIYLVKDGSTYRMMKQLATSTVGSPPNNLPAFTNVSIPGSTWIWSLTATDLEPEPSGNWGNNDPGTESRTDVGSWQSDAVPDPVEDEAEPAAS